jgi:hypothetical protein
VSSSTAATRSASSDHLATPRDWERIRFTAQTAIFGATVGGCAVLVNFLTRAQLPDVPQHMPFGASLYIGSVGGAAGAIFSAPIAYWLYGAQPTFSFYAWRERGPLGWIPWVGFGIGYLLAYPLILGMALPLAVLSTLAWDRLITVPQLLIGIVDLAIRTPVFAITGGLHFFFTGILAALFFIVGVRTIGFLSTARGTVIPRYVTWIIAIGMCLGLAALLVLVPEATLARFGAMR